MENNVENLKHEIKNLKNELNLRNQTIKRLEKRNFQLQKNCNSLYDLMGNFHREFSNIYKLALSSSFESFSETDNETSNGKFMNEKFSSSS